MTIRVRAATTADAEGVAAIYRPFVAEDATSFELAAPDACAMADRIERTIRTHPWIVATEDDAVVGYAYATPFRAREAYRWCVETSVYVDRTRTGQGHGRRLMTVLISLLDDLGFHEAVAGVTLPNAASVRLHESLGFAEVGVFPRSGWKFGRWHDVGFWSRSVREGTPGGEPTAWRAHPAADGRPIDVE